VLGDTYRQMTGQRMPSDWSPERASKELQARRLLMRHASPDEHMGTPRMPARARTSHALLQLAAFLSLL
jgi:hypothetical protein